MTQGSDEDRSWQDKYEPFDDDGQAQWETEMLDYAADMKIQTSHWPKPIPQRQFDWSAVTDNYDYDHPIGYGATEAEAIADLKEQLEDRSHDRA